MNKQVKINIKGKDYYCDSEILKLIMRNQDKIELLEYRIDEAIKMFDIENIEKYYHGMSYEFEILDFKKDILDILKRGTDNE